jgi:LacI family transcriptional regulator
VAAVRAAVARLDYRPNRAARALRAQTTGLIGMAVPSVANPFFAELIGAVERQLHESELELILAESGDSALDEKRACRCSSTARSTGS